MVYQFIVFNSAYMILGGMAKPLLRLAYVILRYANLCRISINSVLQDNLEIVLVFSNLKTLEIIVFKTDHFILFFFVH